MQANRAEQVPLAINLLLPSTPLLNDLHLFGKEVQGGKMGLIRLTSSPLSKSMFSSPGSLLQRHGSASQKVTGRREARPEEAAMEPRGRATQGRA